MSNKSSRRTLLWSVIPWAFALAAAPAVSSAQGVWKPERPIELISGSAAGDRKSVV